MQARTKGPPSEEVGLVSPSEEAGLVLLAGEKQFTAEQVANKTLPVDVEQALEAYIRLQTANGLPCSTLVMLQLATIQDTQATRQKVCRCICALPLFFPSRS
jgi:adenine deaminase